MDRSRHRGTVSLVVALTFLVQIVLPPAWAANPAQPPATTQASTTTMSDPSAFQAPAKPKPPQTFDPQSLIPKPHNPFEGSTDVSDLNARLMENGLDGFQVAAASPTPLPTHRPITLPNGYDASKAPAGTVVQANVFVGREKGKPTETELKFSIAHTAGPFVMHVQNGETNGDNRASSATVSVNDTDVFSQSDFNQEAGTLTRDVEVQSNNTIRVRIASKPGSKIYVAIVDVGKGNITGLVQDADAKTPIKDAKVTLENISQMTPSDGTFSFESILNGTVSLEASKTGYETETKSVTVMSGQTSQVTFNLKDVAPPKVVLTSILPEITKEASQTVSGTVEDINSDIKQVTVFVNETPKQVPVANGVFSAAVSLQEGTNQVKAVAFDQADNKGQSNILTCRLDTGPPEFTITSPTSEAQTSASITLQGTVTEAVTGATIKVNDGEAKPLVLTNLSFSAPVTLKNGENQVVLSGTDAAGNVGTLSERYVYAATGTLSGVVTKAGTNEPIAGAKIQVVNTNFTVTSSIAGTYVIPGIPAGTYNIQASADGFASRTFPALIAVGEITTLNMALSQPIGGGSASVTGYVFKYPEKTPLVGAKVTSTLGGETQTNSDGRFVLQTSSAEQVIEISKGGYTKAERKVIPSAKSVSVGDAYLTPIDPKVTRIGVEGGVASNQTGTALIRIPEGAVESPHDFRVTVLDVKTAGETVLPGPLPGFVPIVAVELQPHGVQFKKPATLLLPNTYGHTPGSRISCAFWNSDKQQWDTYGESFSLEGTVTADGKYIELPVTHFSFYICRVVTSDANPGPGPSDDSPEPPGPSEPPPGPWPESCSDSASDGADPPCTEQPNPDEPCQKEPGNSHFSITTGELGHEYTFPALPSLGGDIQPVLRYHSRLNHPHEISFRMLPSWEGEGTWAVNADGKRYFGKVPNRQWGDIVVEWDGYNGDGQPSAGGYHTISMGYSVMWPTQLAAALAPKTPFASNPKSLTGSIILGQTGGAAYYMPTPRPVAYTFKVFVFGQPQIYGPGWHLSFDRRLYQAADGSGVALVDDTARSLFFKGEALTPPAGVTITLARQDDGGYIERHPDGTTYIYDAEGLVQSKQDRHGNKTTLAWDDGRITSVSNDAGQFYQLAYDSVGRLMSLTDSAGRHHSLAHNEKGLLTEVQDPTGATERYIYDAKNVLTSKTDKQSAQSSYSYDGNGQLKSWADASGATKHFRQVSTTKTVTSQLGNARSDLHGNLWGIQVTGAYPYSKILYRYSPQSDIPKSYQQLGRIISFSFDEYGNMWFRKQINPWEDDPNIYHLDVETNQVTSYSMSGTKPDSLVVVDRNYQAWFVGKVSTGYPPLTKVNLKTGEVKRFMGEGYPKALYENSISFDTYQFDADGNIWIGVYAPVYIDPLNHWVYGMARAKIDIATQDPPLTLMHRSGTYPYQAIDRHNKRRWMVAAIRNTEFNAQFLLEVDESGLSPVSTAHKYAKEMLNREYYLTGDLAVDENGNVWLTAMAEVSPYKFDVFLLSYDPKQKAWRDYPNALRDGGNSPQYISGNRIREFSVAGGHIWLHQNGDSFWTASNRLLQNGWEIEDSRGGKTTHLLDYSGNTLASINSLGHKTEFRYNQQGNLVERIDPLGNSTSYTYDTRRNLLSRTDAVGNITSYTYEPLYNQVATIQDPKGGKVTQTYDAQGNRIATTNQVGLTTNHTYNPDGTISSVTEPGNRKTQYSYDNRGLVTSVTDAVGGTTSLSYDAAGNPTQVTDALGRSSALQYDLLNRLTSYTNALGQSTAYTYNGVGDLVQTTDAKGRSSTFTYDAKRRLTGVSNARGETTQLAYDTEGNLKSVTDPLGHSSAYDYDLADRLAKRTNALGHATTFGYDARGDLTSVKDPLNRATAYAYDAVGRLTTITDAKGNVTGFAYDANGNRTKVIDARGKVYEHVYDAANRLTQLIDPLNRVTRYGYGDCSSCSGGLLAERTDAKGVLTKYTYDALKRLTKIDYPTEQTTFAYNAVGNVTEARNANTTIQLAYDDLNRLIRKEDRGKIIRYAYDEVGNRASMTDPEGQVTAYAYDQVNRLTGMTTPHGDYTLSYDAAGRRLNLAHPNGLVARYSYDDASRLLDVVNEHPATGVVAKAQYTYDVNGNPVTKTDTQGTTTYQYDETDQLIGESGNGKTLAWLYDPVGNRLKETRNGQETTYTHDDANQLLSRSDGTTWTYDANGNMASETGPSVSSTYSFDVENRLTRVQKGSDLWQYVYGPLGERIRRVSPQGERHFQLDGMNVLSEYDQNGNLSARNTHSLVIDEILARQESGQSTHYSVDGLGSVLALTNSDGSKVASFDYDGFGESTQSSAINPYKFTGREDEGNGLYFYRARFYSPSVGRFLSEDPIGFMAGDTNYYRFAWNSPTVFSDISGLLAQPGQVPGPSNDLSGKMTTSPEIVSKFLRTPQGQKAYRDEFNSPESQPYRYVATKCGQLLDMKHVVSAYKQTMIEIAKGQKPAEAAFKAEILGLGVEVDQACGGCLQNPTGASYIPSPSGFSGEDLPSNGFGASSAAQGISLADALLDPCK